MADRRASSITSAPSGFIGIEAGGTRTTAQWSSDAGSLARSITCGPANLQLIDDRALEVLLGEIATALPAPRALAIGMAGARTERDRTRVIRAAGKVWPGRPCAVTHDLEIALAAADTLIAPRHEHRPRVLVLSGTGSCCYGTTATGQPARAGGWGHLLGDDGSAYALALAGLRAAIQAYDESGRWGKLGTRLLTSAHLNEPNALIPWIQAASKSDVAALAPAVFAAAGAGDSLARRVIADGAEALARAAVACARKLGSPRAGRVFVLAGGVLLGQPAFARHVARSIRRDLPAAVFVRLTRPGVEGAVALARSQATSPAPAAGQPVPPTPSSSSCIPAATRISPTEERNPRSTRLDRMSPSEAIDLMIAEDARLPIALRREKRHLGLALGHVVRALQSGGRLFYVGAGTSGRLGILDASECPPTFGTPPERVQGIIAGGQPAIFRSVEGAEDDVAAGAAAIRFRAVQRRDVVIGIAASGRTPFVWGALAEARARGARTVLVCFNPHLRFRRGQRPDVVIAPEIGPELLTGSTRLKAGTATKQILNLLTTLAMVRLGKVVSNLMVDVNPANQKLRERAVRIVRELTGTDAPAATAALERSGWVVKTALQRLARTR